VSPQAERPDQESDEAEVPLLGVRAEFRTALRQEIDAARRNATSSAVALVNGRRIAQVGDAFQYVFDLETALNVPGDAPGDLIVPGGPPVDVVIISVEGMALTLSVAVDLGDFVPAARLQSNLTLLLKRLISRIEGLGSSPNPGGERIRGAEPFAGSPTSIELPGLNRGQHAAVASGLGRDTTFIWGPPGTGKTRTIGALGAALFTRGRSLLMVSHTNAAVDQALMKIADELRGDHREAISAGKVLRVGDPADPQLRHQDELLLATHVARRSHALTERRELLLDEKGRLIQKIHEVSRHIAIVEWVQDAQPDLTAMGADLDDIHRLEDRLDVCRRELEDLRAAASHWKEVKRSASAARDAKTALPGMNYEAATLRKGHAEAVEAHRRREAFLDDAATRLQLARDLEPLRLRAAELPTLSRQEEAAAQARRGATDASKSSDELAAQVTTAEGVLAETKSVGGLARRWKRLPSPDDQQLVVDQLHQRHAVAVEAQTAAEDALRSAESQLVEVAELDRRLAPDQDVPTVDVQTERVAQARSEVGAAMKTVTSANRQLQEAEATIAAFTQTLTSFLAVHHQEPDEVLAAAEAETIRHNETATRVDQLHRRARRRRAELGDLLTARLAALREWRLAAVWGTEVEAMLQAVVDAHERAARKTAHDDVQALRSRHRSLNDRVRSIEVEVAGIDEQLKKVEDLVIAEAVVVATTLTRAYLRDSIQRRRFNTVILDEASMAPIPALWTAAYLADASVVAVGDYKQLPPIVLSRAPEAQRWLGQDIFKVAGITDLNWPDHLVRLTEQFRMHPDISAVVNELIYQGELTDGPGTDDDGRLVDWYRTDWGHDSPVLLVDTASTHAWVTSVIRGDRASRLNFLSATICLDLAEQLLRPDRLTLEAGAPARILIVSPYRPQAKLIELLLRESSLTSEVRAGTAHTFQGSEADVVILDLVNDEPHWKVNLFIPEGDGDNRRLLNVALTRARRRLIVVGDLDYNARQAQKAFLGRELLPALRRNPIVDALDVVPAGLAARAAKGQTAVLGGHVEPDSTRVVVTQADFFPMIAGDISRSRHRVVIYSPFMTENRLQQLAPQLMAATARGVRAYVVTKALADRQKREVDNYRSLERSLSEWGVVVVHKRNMHEKLVFVDNDVLWTGSLNPLSFADTQEVMERRKSAEVVLDYAKTLRLDELVGEYSAGVPQCPICGSEIIASEGKKDPYFWRCAEESCYSRSNDGPRLVGGKVNCSNCAAPVEFGQWGDEDKWRCTANPRHRQSIARTHLRLPAMRALVPKKALRRLDQEFGITKSNG
jgi:hypothetical protein